MNLLFFRAPFFLPLIYRKLIWKIPVSDKIIYLTFDDGPVPGPTEFVLEQLAKFNAKAIFFCIGDNVRKNPVIFNKILANGHSVGNHTFSHLNGWETGANQYKEDVGMCNDVMCQTANSQWPVPSIFRPPYGRITRGQIRELQHYKIIMWDVLSYDYVPAVSAERCLKGTLNATRNGSIVVFHDSVKAEKNLSYTLPRYLEHFSNLGYQFELIPES